MNKLKWVKKVFHFSIYMLAVSMFLSTWASDFLPLYERIFRTGLVFYLVIIYVEFVDGSTLSRFKPSQLFEDSIQRSSNDSDETLIHASRQIIHMIGLIQSSESSTEFEYHKKRLIEHLEHTESLTIPKRYEQVRDDILLEARGFVAEVTHFGSNQNV